MRKVRSVGQPSMWVHCHWIVSEKARSTSGKIVSLQFHNFFARERERRDRSTEKRNFCMWDNNRRETSRENLVSEKLGWDSVRYFTWTPIVPDWVFFYSHQNSSQSSPALLVNGICWRLCRMNEFFHFSVRNWWRDCHQTRAIQMHSIDSFVKKENRRLIGDNAKNTQKNWAFRLSSHISSRVW